MNHLFDIWTNEHLAFTATYLYYQPPKDKMAPPQGAVVAVGRRWPADSIRGEPPKGLLGGSVEAVRGMIDLIH